MANATNRFDIKMQGPYGNRNKENWRLKLASNEKIRGVNIRCGLMVDAIEFVLQDENGRTITRRFGGEGGKLYQIPFKEREYITGISGTHGFFEVNLQRLVASIMIHTNLCPSGYGPYASETSCIDNDNYSILLPSSAFDFVEFYGRCTHFLESLGGSIQRTVEKHGPWGTPEQPDWELELGTHDTFKELRVWSGSVIDKLEFVTTNNREELMSKTFGGYGGKQHKVELKPNEYITNISGISAYFHLSGTYVVESIKIYTNLKPEGYGPFGGSNYDCKDHQEFSSSIPSNYVIVGFFGRGILTYIENIGVSTKMIYY